MWYSTTIIIVLIAVDLPIVTHIFSIDSIAWILKSNGIGCELHPLKYIKNIVKLR